MNTVNQKTITINRVINTHHMGEALKEKLIAPEEEDRHEDGDIESGEIETPSTPAPAVTAVRSKHTPPTLAQHDTHIQPSNPPTHTPSHTTHIYSCYMLLILVSTK